MIGKHIRALRGGRWSHAIDCGDETVIQLDEEGSPALIRRSYRPEFVSGARSVEVVPHREATLPPEEVVARAYSLMGDPEAAARFRDSASFAEWCATGRLGEVATPSPTGTAKQRTRTAPRKKARRKGAPRKTARPSGR